MVQRRTATRQVRKTPCGLYKYAQWVPKHVGWMHRAYKRFQHRIDLLKYKVRSIHLALYRAGPTARQFATAETNRIFAENDIQRSTMKWAAPIIVSLKKDALLRFCVDHRKPIAVNICESYLLLCMNEYIHFIETRRRSLHYKVVLGTNR